MKQPRGIRIAPSLLAADFTRLADEIRRVESGGCDLLHIDVMDGHFVPNLTVGPFIVQAIRKITKLPLDAHLMIEHPGKYLADFARAGADHITFHAEACQDNLEEIAGQVKALSVGCGVSLRPQTPLAAIEKHLDLFQMVLLMTVNPGFGGQSFMPEVLPKIRELRARYTGAIEVDGGINRETARLAVEAGADVLVAGTAIFASRDPAAAVKELRGEA